MTTRAVRQFAPHVAAPLAVAALLAVVGPFGTFDDMNFAARLVYWGAIVPLNWLQMELVIRLCLRRLPDALPQGAAVAAAVVLASVPATIEVLALEALLRPKPLSVHPLAIYVFVVLLTAGITAPVWMLRLRQDDPAAPGTDGDGIPFLRRIPAKLGQDLLCLGMEDHYLRIYTAVGDDLILMRLKDAEAELAAVDGLRVHRSWWVARKAVRAVKRDGERVMLELVNGVAVPVSRANVAALKGAGWLV